jgi:SurA-like protein
MIPSVLKLFRHFRDALPGDCRSGWILLIISMFWMGCTNSGSAENSDCLIRVRSSVISVGEFKKAFEIAKSAYTHNEIQNPPALRAAQQRLLNQLTEELILIERAKDLDIQIVASEIESAVADIKSDYPEGDFEKMLLENAVSYPIWKNRLERRLLMEKVIDEDLKNRITIEPNEILAYYDAHVRSKSVGFSESEDINEVIVMQLRRKKAESAYSAWIKTLQEEYTIEIDQKQWEKIAAL